jgi:hypothetical protein
MSRLVQIVLLGKADPSSRRLGRADLSRRDVLDAEIDHKGQAKILTDGWDHNLPIPSMEYRIVPSDRSHN